MQSVADPKPDRTPEVVPEIQHTVLWRVVSVTALPERRLKVTFVDEYRRRSGSQPVSCRPKG